MKKAYFQYYESFEKIVQKFGTAEERESFRTKIINYGLYGQEPEDMNDREEFVWDIVRDMIDDQMHRRQVNKDNRNQREAKRQDPKPAEPETEPATEPAAEPKQKRFSQPTVEEVAAYCQERGNDVNAEKFCSYYAAQGWKVGNHPMKDWKAAVRTWEQNQKDRPSYGYGPPKQEWPEDKLQL